jgi:hypothetical protein
VEKSPITSIDISKRFISLSFIFLLERFLVGNKAYPLNESIQIKLFEDPLKISTELLVGAGCYSIISA